MVLVSDVYFKTLGVNGIISLSLLSYGYGITYALIRQLLRARSEPKISEVVRIVRLLEVEEQYNEVISIGSGLSRHLWVTGRSIDRIEIGIIVWISAGITQLHDEEKLHAAIDMVGWTSEVVGDSLQEEMYLKRAITLAKEKNYAYFLAKAHRHCGGIYYRHNQFDKAEDELSKAEEAAKGIHEEKKRKEMMAGICFGRAKIQLG